MMEGKKISIVSVEFSVFLSREELPVLKEVIDNNLGLSGIVNRWKESECENGFLPVFQYKNVADKTLLLIYGWDLSPLMPLFIDTDWSVWIRARKEQLKVTKVSQHSCEIGVCDSFYHYSLKDWFPGVKDHLRAGRFDSPEKEVSNILCGDVLDGLESLGVGTDDVVDTIVINFGKGKQTGDGADSMAFYDLEFASNVVFPEFFSLGKDSDVGFGVISLKKGQPVVSSKRRRIMSGE